ncbi:FxsC protein [Actinoplanes sp. M2I2]|uniref:FxsC protein n=1 Tax=Actinoplanes sp. M2I2 TaxID=1734444 RepID=UPI002021412B|nr:FxsC protein [Actinoplanes sp. M2I2]
MRQPRYYFHLSHGHSVRLRADDRPGADHWPGQLFTALSAEVARLAGADRRVPVGHHDGLVRPLADRKAALAGALSGTDVFVALYAPGYFNKSWPLRERASFVSRYADPAMGERFLLPVHWVPWPPGEHDSERVAALRLGAGIPEYAEEGLQAMSRLSLYRRQYRTLVRRLAYRIVTLAADAPRPAPLAAAIDDVSAGPAAAGAIVFTVAVLAPTRLDLPPGRSAASYGPAARAWSPYRDLRRFPVAAYVADVADRLGQPVRVVDRPADMFALGQGAALVLIDPWAAATPDGLERLSALTGRIPEWASVLLLADRSDPEYAARGATLHATVADTLVTAGIARGRITLLRDADRLVERAPALVDQACAAYRRNAPERRTLEP